jgi:hypothetical protein
MVLVSGYVSGAPSEVVVVGSSACGVMLAVVAVQLRSGLCQFITMGVSVDVQDKQFTFVMCCKDVDRADDEAELKWMFVWNRMLGGVECL